MTDEKALEAAQDYMELPDDLRIPLHSLQADIGYLIGRVALDGSVAGIMQTSAEDRLSQVAEAAYRLNGEVARLRERLASAERDTARRCVATLKKLRDDHLDDQASGDTAMVREYHGDMAFAYETGMAAISALFPAEIFAENAKKGEPTNG